MKKNVFTAIFFFLLAMSLLTAHASPQTELHWSLCEESADVVIEKLGLELKDTERRNVSYYDLWNEELQDFESYSQGVVLRLRSFEDKTFKSTVKIRFDEMPEISEEWSSLKGFKCEFDLNSSKQTQYCSLSEDVAGFSALQKKFVTEYAVEPQWEFLKAHGPVANTVWEFKRPQREKLVLEQMILSKGEVILELSTRTDTHSAKKEFLEQSEWLAEKQIKLCEIQESKTRKVLESYKGD